MFARLWMFLNFPASVSRLHTKLDALLERTRIMSINFTDLTAAVDNAVAHLSSDDTALAQAQADLAAAQAEITAAQATVDDLTAKLKAKLKAATPST